MILSYFTTRYRPAHPDISPIYGDLANMPPILVHASNHEMLRDDGRRYVNKARQAGTDARLQLWQHMPHVWHIFYPNLPEADQAFEQIRLFINQHS
jgi:acetyl esterase/lipase